MYIKDKFRIIFYSNGVYLVAPKNQIKNLTLDKSIMRLRNEYAMLNNTNHHRKNEIVFSGDSLCLNGFFGGIGGPSGSNYGFMPNE